MTPAEPLILYLRGRVEMADFLAMADLLALERPLVSPSNILFDWSGISSWDFRPPQKHELERSLLAIKFIGRAAILHHRRLNRPAAWFAAFLRTRNCCVRSYNLWDYSWALLWLAAAAPEVGRQSER